MSLVKNHCYEYPRPALTVDAVIFTFIDEEIKVVLIKRADEPFKDRWAFPGGFVNENETADEAVKRELFEETGLSNIQLEQFYTATAPGRDPRGWTVSVVFIGFTPAVRIELKAGDDAKEAAWHTINSLPKLAFDHSELLKKGLETVRTKMRFLIIARTLLQPAFTRDQFLNLGRLLGFPENDVQQRFHRFIRIGLINEAGEKDQYHFNAERFDKTK